jgi:hypothetical protein
MISIVDDKSKFSMTSSSGLDYSQKDDKKKLKLNLRYGYSRNINSYCISCKNAHMSIMDDKSKLSVTSSSGLDYSQKDDKKNIRYGGYLRNLRSCCISCNNTRM